jgi:PBP1b-binding outer membrane lipoprotein LpoB
MCPHFIFKIVILLATFGFLLAGCSQEKLSPEEKFLKEQQEFIKKRDANPKFVESNQSESKEPRHSMQVKTHGKEYEYVKVVAKVTCYVGDTEN